MKDNGRVIIVASEIVGSYVEAKVDQTTRALGLCAIRMAVNAEHPDPQKSSPIFFKKQ